ncbi:hypothetical protein [Streptomyces omiyaensis]|uniref:hypothetical protein n=1 Tax=Streptomyces omiyaensis TaxID=68247 RepID=UPI003702D39D
MDPFDRVGLFRSAFGQVPTAAHAQARTMDEAAAWARKRHPEWFDLDCGGEDCPSHCPVGLGRAPYLFDWDDHHDSRYVRSGVPARPLGVSELPADVAAAARLVPVGFPFDRAPRVDLGCPGGREAIRASSLTPCTCCRPHPGGREASAEGEAGVP